MRWLLCLVSITLMLGAGAASAERPVTAEEKTALVAAMLALGCTGGKMEFDDGAFEIEDAKCADGKTYDLKFDKAFKLIEKELSN
jgi:hypothetical protein